MSESSGTNRSCDLTIIFIDHRFRDGASILFWSSALKISCKGYALLNCEFTSGVYVEGVTPLPIPNREVKPLGADGTIWVTVWESRTMPGFCLQPRVMKMARGFFLYCAQQQLPD